VNNPGYYNPNTLFFQSSSLSFSISKTLMNDVSSVPIGDFENEQRDSSAALGMLPH
jgi:hypothetical protein